MTATTLSVIRPQTGVGRWVAALLSAWLFAAVYASVNQLPAATPWMMPLLIAIPLAGFAAAWLGLPALRHWALALDRRFLILIHATRTLGLGFVMLYFHQSLPAGFAFAAGLGDAIAAVWALLLGVAMYQGADPGRRAIAAWNTFGVLDFVAAVSIGLASRAAPVGLVHEGATTDPMGLFPLSLIPLFAVPFFLMIHLIIYAQLRRRA